MTDPHPVAESERPNHLQDMHHNSNSSFHSRALAVTAANRFRRGSASKSPALSAHSGGTSPPTNRPLPGPSEHTPLLSKSPLSPRSGVLASRSPEYHATITETSTPEGSPKLGARRMSTDSSMTSMNSMAPVYTWLGGGGGTGDEPGVDVRSKRDEEAWGHLKGDTQVTVVDYTSDPEGKNVRVEFEGERLKEWLNSVHAQRLTGDDGKPRGARWIHIEGVNWEVIKTLTLEYGLHPLAVEDALRAPNSPRSKLDFYNSHLYCQILVQHMHPGDDAKISESVEDLSSWHLPGESHLHGTHPDEMEDDTLGKPATAQRKRRQSNGLFLKLPEGVQGVFEPTIDPPRGRNQSKAYVAATKKSAHRLTVDELSAKYMVPIRRAIISLFLTRDGTLITFTRRPLREVLHPVYARLEDEASLLRRSGDVSMLAQALLDVSVDLAIEISQTFESEILRLEASVLVDPSVRGSQSIIETVRHLHVLSSQLIRLRRSLTPLLHVAYIIRDQDAARSAAASAMTAGPRPGDRNHMSRDSQWLAGAENQEHHSGHISSPPQMQNIPILTNTGPTRPGTPAANKPFGSLGPSSSNSLILQNAVGQGAQGFFSPMTKVYIGDVLDHLEIIVSNMDQFVATCDHLTDYVFNVLSFQTNASMERLSIVTVVFLPLTFIASYFGMNFEEFPSLANPDSYFWKVAAPCTVGFFVIFSWTYLKLGLETFGRRLGRWRNLRLVRSGSVRQKKGEKVQ